ncbi:MAG: muconolactone delta-isomerase [Homoserinimonas sp.]|nr:muconolactone delta-isomerase [Homoserinimonas sp.]
MLFLVRMDVHLPIDMPAETAERIKLLEKEYAAGLQLDGRWKELWRVVGEYANYSVFDVADNNALHEILGNLPLFPYMALHVTPLASHPSRVTSTRVNTPQPIPSAKEQQS